MWVGRVVRAAWSLWWIKSLTPSLLWSHAWRSWTRKHESHENFPEAIEKLHGREIELTSLRGLVTEGFRINTTASYLYNKAVSLRLVHGINSLFSWLARYPPGSVIKSCMSFGWKDIKRGKVFKHCVYSIWEGSERAYCRRGKRGRACAQIICMGFTCPGQVVIVY